MKKTLITAAALAACAGTQLFAQKMAKQDTITFALTGQYQNSVSTSTSPERRHLGCSCRDTIRQPRARSRRQTLSRPSLSFCTGTQAFTVLKPSWCWCRENCPASLTSTDELAAVGDRNDTARRRRIQSDIDDLVRATLPVAPGGTVPALATGRHFLPSPTAVGAVTGEWPPGHHQPWGQIFVQDPGKAGFSASNPLCENVTFFFAITVEECYDCFYLNSFISDATFKFKSGNQSGPPCCSVPGKLDWQRQRQVLHDLEL